MSNQRQILSLIPRSYKKLDLSFLETGVLEDVEKGIRKLGEQTSAAWLVTSLVVYGVLYDGELYSASGLPWREYRNETRKRLGMEYREFSESFAAGRFLIDHGKKLISQNWNPERTARKIARSELALKLCGDVDLVIEHILSDSWEEFKAWYTGLKNQLKIAEPVRRKQKRIIEVKRGRLYVGGIEPVTVNEAIPEQERKDIERMIKEYYQGKK